MMVSILLSILSFSATILSVHCTTDPFLKKSGDATNDYNQVEQNIQKFIGTSLRGGFIPVGEEGGYMFYTYAPHKGILPPKEYEDHQNAPPLIVWLTGGPGCSSFLAAVLENGPVRFSDSNVLEDNPNSWTEIAEVVYVDQPLGTGFSTAGDWRNYDTDEDQIANHMRQFFTRFFEEWPVLRLRRLFIAGESYAGHYIPVIAKTLLDHPIEGVTFDGIALGNAWVNPLIQYASFTKYATLTGLLIDQKSIEQSNRDFKICCDLIEEKKYSVAMEECAMATELMLGDRSPYDIRRKCEFPPLCLDVSPVEELLKNDDVRTFLGVPQDASWSPCSDRVRMYLMGEWISSFEPVVKQLLESPLKVLVYHGDQDLICNWVGGLEWTEGVRWSHQHAFQSTHMREWTVDSISAGETKSSQGLTFMRVYDAGHMVPRDQGRVSLEMMSQFVQKQISAPQPDISAAPHVENWNLIFD